MSFFLFLFVLGVTAPGNPALKRRQRDNGRTYKIPVDRPKIIEDYNKNMGYVDRHNRFRHDILGLAHVWRTKKWQTRMIVEIIGMVIVDTFLLARKFMPKYMNLGDEESTFWKFMEGLVPQIYPDREEGSSIAEPDNRVLCTQVKLPPYTISSGKYAGKIRTQQQRCIYCVKHKRKGGDGRATRTSWTCICHPQHYCCKNAACWTEHLAANECGLSDDEGNDARAESGSSSDEGSTRYEPRMPVTKRQRQVDQDEFLHEV